MAPLGGGQPIEFGFVLPPMSLLLFASAQVGGGLSGHGVCGTRVYVDGGTGADLCEVALLLLILLAEDV